MENPGYHGPRIENDDFPIVSLRLTDPGPTPERVFALFRSLTGATPEQARQTIHTPESELARDSRIAINSIAEKYRKTGAKVSFVYVV